MVIENTIAATILLNYDELEHIALQLDPSQMSAMAADVIKMAQEQKGQFEIVEHIINKYGQEKYDVFMSNAVLPTEIETLVNIYKESVLKRKIKMQVIKLSGLLKQDKPLNEIQDEILQLENSVKENVPNVFNMEDAVKESGDFIVKVATNQERLRLPFFEDFVPFLLGGELIVIGARPSMGKTAFMLDLAYRLASNNVPVGFVSLEMNTKTLMLRMAQRHLNFNVFRQLKYLKAGTPEYRALLDEISSLKSLPIYISDNTSQSVYSIINLAKQMKAFYGVKVLFIDYLQLMASNTTQNRVNELEMITRSLKVMAMKTGLVLVLASQLSRNVENRENKEPILADLRGSGSIEQDADVVSFLYREGYYNPNIDPSLTELLVLKQRNGVIGRKEMIFNLEKQTFLERSVEDAWDNN